MLPSGMRRFALVARLLPRGFAPLKRRHPLCRGSPLKSRSGFFSVGGSVRDIISRRRVAYVTFDLSLRGARAEPSHRHCGNPLPPGASQGSVPDKRRQLGDEPESQRHGTPVGPLKIPCPCIGFCWVTPANDPTSTFVPSVSSRCRNAAGVCK